ncbi:chemotaxis protein CheW [Papillibacter cinnamivorans]|uniref:Chemotaxis protein CheW n=1 Tax=Papillibacter cinnamivorans DSM 12816 TaxID=1122930 RepID=A0A1W1YI55_9FIRM|nr:chemotaxis protein CheW [Papillibacter cinnamivorans]SMC35865.1 purine-binding chemotaxis protein CheW [Papillibacter cinnamivorans DSM 12816]
MVKTQEEILELEEDTQKGKFLTFSLGKEVYAIEIKFVTEIIGIQPITEVPELPNYVKGIINLRGKIIPVIDIRLRFKKPPADYTDRTCIIVVEMKDVSIGLIVDNVSEVLSIADDDIVPPPEISQGTENRYLKAIGKVEGEVKLILECVKLMNDNEMEAIGQIA